MTRAPVPDEWLAALRRMVAPLPECREEKAWTGVRWKVRGATVAHLFGGEDGLVRLTFRAPMDEVAAFEHLGHPYFRVGRSGDAVGLVLADDPAGAAAGGADVELEEVGELLTDSYRVQAPLVLVQRLEPRP